MIEQISLVLTDESGNFVPLKKTNETHVETKTETAIADLFSEICRANNRIADREIRIAEKFGFALNLKNYLQEIKENVDRTAD